MEASVASTSSQISAFANAFPVGHRSKHRLPVESRVTGPLPAGSPTGSRTLIVVLSSWQIWHSYDQTCRGQSPDIMCWNHWLSAVLSCSIEPAAGEFMLSWFMYHDK